jgi:diketogulonate reductase-like aldo/keto reductase
MAPSQIPLLKAGDAEIPAIGFGTSSLGNCAEIVAQALGLGYRHLDTAWKYGTEDGVGEGMRAAGVPRDEVFLCTKVSHEYLHADAFARSVDESLTRLGVGYVDLLLVHWPNAAIPLAETMGALAKAKRQGLTRHIGVANFNIALLDEAIRLCPEPIVNLQAEYHPYLDQAKLLAACRQRGIVFTAYCPLGRGRIVGDPVLENIAQRRGRSLAQIALRWLIQQGNVIPIPRSSNPGRMRENLAVFDFALTDEEMNEITALKRTNGRIANPAGRAPAWD